MKAGYLPLCPVLAFSGIIGEDDPDGEKKRREMSEDLLKRARFLVVCGERRSMMMSGLTYLLPSVPR